MFGAILNDRQNDVGLWLWIPGPRQGPVREGRGLFWANAAYPDRRWLVFCTRLPCAACSRMLCFSSSRWPLVVSSGTDGALPGPLWLCASEGTGCRVLFNGFVIAGLRCLVC